MPNKIRYINSFAAGTQHSVFNRATLKMFADLRSGDVSVWSVPSSLPPLLTVDNADDVRAWHRLPVGDGTSGFGLALRYIQSAVSNVWLLLRARPDDLVVYNFNNVFSIHAVDLLCRLLNRQVIVFCHNELEYLVNGGKFKALNKRILTALTRGYFSRRRRPARGLKFIVLGDSILVNLKPLISPELAEVFYSIDHPITPLEDSTRNESHFSGVVNVGVVGTVNTYKGGEELADIVSAVGSHSQVRFSVIGTVQGDAAQLRSAGIVLPAEPSRPVPEPEFSEAVGALDFILLLYPADTYRLIASGAVLEALRFGKPVIAYRTAYFEYLFRKFGAFGYLVDTRDEMIDVLKRTKTLSRDFPFSKIASQLSVEAISPALLKIVAD